MQHLMVRTVTELPIKSKVCEPYKIMKWLVYEYFCRHEMAVGHRLTCGQQCSLFNFTADLMFKEFSYLLNARYLSFSLVSC